MKDKIKRCIDFISLTRSLFLSSIYEQEVIHMQLPQELPLATSKALHLNLDTSLAARRARLQGWQEVGNVIPWMSVQTSAQSLLVEVMCNQTNASAQHEETVKNTHLQVVLGFLGTESAT